MKIRYLHSLVVVFCLSSLNGEMAFVTKASAALLTNAQLREEGADRNYVVVRTWGDEHASLEIVQHREPRSTYISLHNNNTPHGDVHQPRWGNLRQGHANYDENVMRRGADPEEMKLFSLRRDLIIRRLEEGFLENIYYHPHGDTHTTSMDGVYPHNCSSVIVELLKIGGIVEERDAHGVITPAGRGVLQTNQQNYKDKLWVATKGVTILGSTGTLALGAPVAAAIGSGVVGAGGVVLGHNPARLALRETRAAVFDNFQSKKYGHPVLAPVGGWNSFGERYFETTVHQLKDLMRRARAREQQIRDVTAGWV